MKALVLQKKGEYPVYTDFDIPDEYKERERVDLLFSALNHRDLWIIKGLYAGLRYPVILGSDGYGTYKGRNVIINPGQNWGDNEAVQSKEFKILGLPDHGTFADAVYVEKKYIYDAPAHLQPHEAAALPLAGLTAYRALFTKAGARKGQKIFISGIGGGVALFVLLFARAMEMEIYVSSSSKEKLQKAKKLGAVDGVLYTDEDWDSKLKEMSGGVDIVIDSAGGKGFHRFLKIINPGGKIVIYGGTRGVIDGISPQILFWKQITIMGTTMGSDRDFKNMLDFVNCHKITPVIDSVFSIKEFDKAIKRMESGQQFGKIVLDNKGQE